MSFAVAEESCTHCWDATLEKDTILLRIVFYLPWKEQMRRLAAKENRSKRNSQCELQGFEFLLPQESEITGTTAVWWHWLLSRCLPQITVQKGGTTRVLKQAPGSSSVFVGVAPLLFCSWECRNSAVTGKREFQALISPLQHLHCMSLPSYPPLSSVQPQPHSNHCSLLLCSSAFWICLTSSPTFPPLCSSTSTGVAAAITPCVSGCCDHSYK